MAQKTYLIYKSSKGSDVGVGKAREEGGGLGRRKDKINGHLI